jgi:hypothetical protein
LIRCVISLNSTVLHSDIQQRWQQKSDSDRSVLWSQIDAYDAYIKKLNDYKKAESDRIAASQAAADALRDFSADIVAMMNLGRSGGMPTHRVRRQRSRNFVTPLDACLGRWWRGTEIEAKVKKLSAMVEMLYNTSISGATEFIRTQASRCLQWLPLPCRGPEAKKAMESGIRVQQDQDRHRGRDCLHAEAQRAYGSVRQG